MLSNSEYVCGGLGSPTYLAPSYTKFTLTFTVPRTVLWSAHSHYRITSVLQGLFRASLTLHCVSQGVLFAVHVVDIVNVHELYTVTSRKGEHRNPGYFGHHMELACLTVRDSHSKLSYWAHTCLARNFGHSYHL